MRERGFCQYCKRLYDFHLGEYDKVIAHCEAYPNGIPEAVFYAGHFYPKPDDNGLQFLPKKEDSLPDRKSENAENKKYQELKEYYIELDMSEEEWTRLHQKEKIKKKKKKYNSEKKYKNFWEESSDILDDLFEEEVPEKLRRDNQPKFW